MNRILSLLCVVMVHHLSTAQDHIPPMLRGHIQQVRSSQEDVHLFLLGDVAAVRQAVHNAGGVVKMSAAGVVSARVPAEAVSGLLASDLLQGVEFSLVKGQPLNDSMRVHNRIDIVQQGTAPLPQGYDGEGVILGIIDSGLDMDHPDFNDAQGNTRVLKYWDQNYPFNAQLTPQPYGYGQVWDSTLINAGLCPAGEQAGYFGHGTTVTGTAVGNGLATGNYTGVAPKADIIVVSSKFNAPNWKAVVVDAVQYILDEAAVLNRPVVINASLGDYLGSHDGKDAAAILIDSMLNAAPGRVMVCAAGNSGAYPKYHLETLVTADTSFTWFKYNPTSALGYGAVYFEVWADTAEFSQVQYAVGADRATPSYRYRGRTDFHGMNDHLNSTGTDSLFSLSGDLLAVVDYYAQLRGAQVQLAVHLQQPDSNAYNFRFMTTGTGRFDVWSADFFGLSKMVTAIPTVVQFPPIVNYVLPDSKKVIVDSWACSDEVITVANYYNEVAYTDVNGNPQTVPGTEGALSTNSSHGPTRDLRIKPDIAATGDITLTAGPLSTLATLIANEPHKVAPGGMHMRNGGTSMASPVVAGAAALYLQKCPRATHTEVMNALFAHAVADGFTGSVPNDQWGAGKLNAFDALVQSNFTVGLSIFGDTILCAGDSVLMSGPAMMDSYLWTTGDTTKLFYHNMSGPLSLVVQNSSGCKGWSDTLNFTMLPPVTPPLITQSGALLESTPAPFYQWFIEGTPIGGADQQSYTVDLSGNYYVQVTDSNGCTANSDTVFVIITSVLEGEDQSIKVWPVPAADRLNVRTTNGSIERVVVTDQSGRMVMDEQFIARTGQVELSIEGLPAGLYQLTAFTDRGQFRSRFVRAAGRR